MPPPKQRSGSDLTTRDLSTAEKISVIFTKMDEILNRVNDVLRVQGQHADRLSALREEDILLRAENASNRADLAAAHDKIRGVGNRVESLERNPEWKPLITDIDKQLEELKPTVSFIKKTAVIAYPIIISLLIGLIWKVLTTPAVQQIQVIVTATPPAGR
jgi:hypothetical protein